MMNHHNEFQEDWGPVTKDQNHPEPVTFDKATSFIRFPSRLKFSLFLWGALVCAVLFFNITGTTRAMAFTFLFLALLRGLISLTESTEANKSGGPGVVYGVFALVVALFSWPFTLAGALFALVDGTYALRVSLKGVGFHPGAGRKLKPRRRRSSGNGNDATDWLENSALVDTAYADLKDI